MTNAQVARKYAQYYDDCSLVQAAREYREESLEGMAYYRHHKTASAPDVAAVCFAGAMDCAKAARACIREYDRRHAWDVDLAAEVARSAAIVAAPAPRCPGDTAPHKATYDRRYEDDGAWPLPVYDHPTADDDDLFELPPPPPEIKLVF